MLFLAGSGAADGGYDGLRGCGPSVHVEVGGAFAVVWLVHDAEDDARLRCPVCGDLRPGCCEDVCAGTVLADDAVRPAAVVVDVDAEGEVSKFSLCCG